MTSDGKKNLKLDPSRTSDRPLCLSLPREGENVWAWEGEREREKSLQSFLATELELSRAQS